MRYILAILIACNFLASAQKDFKNFNGSLIYKETRFHEPITRSIADTVSCFYAAEVRDDVDMEAVSILGGEEISVQYLRFNLIKQHDSIFIKYFDPQLRQTDSTFLFPLLKKDTIEGCKGYKIRVDSSPDPHSTHAKKRIFLDFCLDNPN